MFIVILLGAQIAKHGVQSVSRGWWGAAAMFALFALYELYADWREPKSK
jgi:hypothetical protein